MLSPQCWTCRRRRVLCDSQTPTCRKCSAKGVECLGYGETKPLVWIEGSNARKRRQKRQHANLELRVRDQSPSLPLPVEEVDRPELVNRALGRTLHPIADFNSYTVLGDHASVIRAFEYYNRFIAPLLTPLHLEGEPQAIPPFTWQYWPPVMQDLIALLSWRHRHFRSRIASEPWKTSSETLELEQSISKRSAQALAEVNRRLSHKEDRTDDLTLIAVLTLFLTEARVRPLLIQSSRNGIWRVHLKGLRYLLNLRGGLESIVDAPKISRGLKHMTGMFVLIEIIRLVTTDLSAFTDTNLQPYYLSFVPTLFKDAMWSYFPCPASLIGWIAQANDLRLQIHHHSVPTATGATSPDIHASILSLTSQALSYDPLPWAKLATYMQAKAHDKPTIEIFAREFEVPDEAEAAANEDQLDPKYLATWTAMTAAHHEAVLLYVLRSLYVPHAVVAAAGEQPETHYIPVDGALFGCGDIPPSPGTTGAGAGAGAGSGWGTAAAASAPTSVAVSVSDLIAALTARLHANIDLIFGANATSTQFHLFTSWPLFMSGLHADPYDEPRKALVLKRLDDLMVQLGAECHMDGRMFLDGFWRRQLEEGPVGDWDDIFRGVDPQILL